MKLLNIKERNLYYIGGIVRDTILGNECFDIDITYVGDAIEYAQKNNLKILKTNKNFGTVVTENMGGYSWYKNSRLNRISKWSNDEILDTSIDIKEMIIQSKEKNVVNTHNASQETKLDELLKEGSIINKEDKSERQNIINENEQNKNVTPPTSITIIDGIE